LKPEISGYHYDTLNCFAYFTCCPFIPTCSYTTSIMTAPSTMAAGGVEKEISNNLDTHRYFPLIHIQKLKGCDTHV